MKILFIVPGSGDSFYCGNCFRDNLQASALRKAGHEVIVMPLYLPLRHRSFQADTPLFFPATTFYTAQKFFGKRKMPDWLKRITGSDTLLNVASSLSGSTSAEGLEEMTLAMITGKDAAFLDMVDQLICWVKDREKPDIIHLSSTLLIGIAKEIKRYLDTPIVCSVQDEGKYSINSLVYWVTYVHNVVYSFYRSMIYCYINSTQRCAGSIVIDIIPTNGADKRKFFPFAPYFPVTNVIKRYFYPYFPAIIGIKGYSFPYFPYLSGIMKIKTALYSLFSRLDWHKTVVFPCLGEIYEGIRSLSWEIPVT